MKKQFILAIILCELCSPAFCCLNYYYTADKDGHLHYQGTDDDIMIGFNTNFNLRLLSEKIGKQETTVKTEKSFEALSDYSVMLMKMARNDVALTILQSLYAAHPDQYQLAANLGTSYELAGEVDSALKYIKRGIELNPNAHEGSEWVHVKVLETKLKMRTDSNYLLTHTVLNLTPAQENDSLVGHQIEIQVRERFPFCPGPDLIMASLLEDLADVTLNTNSIEDAKAYYNICKYYFGDSSLTMNNKIKETMNLLEKYSTVRPEERRNEGDNVRLGPYRYAEMLDDNNPDKHVVVWSQVNTDAAALLAIVGLKPIPERTDTTNVAPVVDEPTEADAAVEEQGSMWWIIIVVLASCSTLVSLIWYNKRKK